MYYQGRERQNINVSPDIVTKANEGNPRAQLELGKYYYSAASVGESATIAFGWIHRSAEQGNMEAQFRLGDLYALGFGTAKNLPDSYKWYTKAAIQAAEAGDSQAQVTLGMLYRKGDYVKPDISTAVRWYMLAARQNNSVSQNCLVNLYERGLLLNIQLEEDVQEYLTEDSMNSRLCSKLSIDVSKLEALSGFRHINKIVKFALTGDGPSMYEIGLNYYNGDSGFPLDKDTGIKWIKNAANREHKDAQFMMADLYKKGESIEQDYQKAYIWYKVIAKRKDADAQCNIGIMYKEGLGVRKDPLEASKWFTWAADQEDSHGQYQFGMLRLHGSGIKKDKAEAEEFFYKSAHHKNTDACYELGKIYVLDSTESNQKLKTGLKLLEFAAKHRHGDTQLALGDMYKKGESLEMDLSKCIEYYTMAADSGNKDAQYKLALIYFNGEGIKCDYIMAYNLFKQANNKGHTGASMLFQMPVQYNSNINDYTKVIEMFTEVTIKKIEDLAYNIGSMYEHGVKDDSGVEHFDTNYENAQIWYVIASNKEDSRADYRSGSMFQSGKGVTKNIPIAIHYYNNAVKKENVDAIYRLAVIYLNGYNIIHDSLEAFHLYTKAATMGHKKSIEVLTALQMDTKHQSEASYLDINTPTLPVYEKNRINMLERATEEGYTRLHYQLGLIHEHNNDKVKAFKWFSLAAEIGITDAYYRLGVMYEEGRGIEQTYEIAADMYQKATENNHEDACFRLGRLYQYGNGATLDYLKAYNFYKKAAGMDHKMASKVLNITQEPGIQSNEMIEKSFFDLLSKEYQDSLTMCEYVARHDNDSNVQFKLGFAYENNSLEPHYTGAFKWYSMAAKNSHKEAMYHLGLLYENGLGVSQDYQKAIELYNRAYQRGNEDALYRLGTVYHHGKGVEINPEKAIECYTLSAKLGNPKYQCELGRLYEEGELLEKNLLESLKWYTKAYLQGYDNIRPKLYEMYEDRPYESFLLKRLVRNLTIASYNYFSLNDEYKYKHYGDINKRLGFMYFFGIGTDKNLKQSIQHFFKPYSDQVETTNTVLRFFEYNSFDFNQKMNILNEFGKYKECLDLLAEETLYQLAMVFYDGKIQSKCFSYDTQKKVYTFIDELDVNNPNQSMIIKKDYSSALSYLERAAGEKCPNAWFQLGTMYYYGYGVQKNSYKGDRCFERIPLDDIESVKRLAILCHTHIDIKNFSRIFECYNRLEKMLNDNSGLSEKYRKEINEFTQTGLGLLYEYGDGVEKDYQEAFHYYKKLAENKSAVGYIRLGLMYYYGKGVPVDYGKARDLIYNSDNGNTYGDKIPYIYEEENNLQTSDHVDYSGRNLFYCAKTESEIAGERKYYQGLMFKHGHGVPKDKDKAQYYFKRALNLGCQRAVNRIK